MLAIERFGTANERPQDQDRHLLLFRRKINKGLFVEHWRSLCLPSGFDWKFCDEPGVNKKTALPPENKRDPIFISLADNTFDEMICELSRKNYFAFDLEFNDDHSYEGIILLLSMGETNALVRWSPMLIY